MTHETEMMIGRIRSGALTEEDRQTLEKLLRRDIPANVGTYYGYVDGVRRNFLRCARCGMHLRRPSEKRPIKYSRFCPACGQRIDWYQWIKDNGDY